MSWSSEDTVKLLLAVIGTYKPVGVDWKDVAQKLGSGRSGGACQQKYQILLRDGPPAIMGKSNTSASSSVGKASPKAPAAAVNKGKAVSAPTAMEEEEYGEEGEEAPKATKGSKKPATGTKAPTGAAFKTRSAAAAAAAVKENNNKSNEEDEETVSKTAKGSKKALVAVKTRVTTSLAISDNSSESDEEAAPQAPRGRKNATKRLTLTTPGAKTRASVSSGESDAESSDTAAPKGRKPGLKLTIPTRTYARTRAATTAGASSKRKTALKVEAETETSSSSSSDDDDSASKKPRLRAVKVEDSSDEGSCFSEEGDGKYGVSGRAPPEEDESLYKVQSPEPQGPRVLEDPDEYGGIFNESYATHFGGVGDEVVFVKDWEDPEEEEEAEQDEEEGGA